MKPRSKAVLAEEICRLAAKEGLDSSFYIGTNRKGQGHIFCVGDILLLFSALYTLATQDTEIRELIECIYQNLSMNDLQQKVDACSN